MDERRDNNGIGYVEGEGNCGGGGSGDSCGDKGDDNNYGGGDNDNNSSNDNKNGGSDNDNDGSNDNNNGGNRGDGGGGWDTATAVDMDKEDNLKWQWTPGADSPEAAVES